MKTSGSVLFLAAMLVVSAMLVGLAPASAPPADPHSLAVRLEPIPAEYRNPVFLADPGDGSDRLFVVEQRGVVKLVLDGVPSIHPFLDIRDLVRKSGAEQGLLSIAFHPQFSTNATFFVAYTDHQDSVVIARYRASQRKPNKADPESAQILLSVPKPYKDHNAGLIAFGPDGFMYIGIGDGGGSAEPDGNAQRLDNLLGKILRVDVDVSQGDLEYGIPADNPFVGSDTARPEIWAYGLRNPWRFSFDRETGELYIGDVGMGGPEEINLTNTSIAGLNFAWNVLEGERCMRPVEANACDAEGLERPVHTYEHVDGKCAVVGGYVYRGSFMPELRGAYLFADVCAGTIWTMRLIDDTWRVIEFLDTDTVISSFAEDANGELFVISLRGTIVRLLPGADADTPSTDVLVS